MVRNFWKADKILRRDSGLLSTSPSPAFWNLPSTCLVFSVLTSASMTFSNPWLGRRPVDIRNLSLVASVSVIVRRNWTLAALPSELWYWTMDSLTTMSKISTELAMD